MKNYIILHLVKDDKVIIAKSITPDEASRIAEYSTKLYVNETGGITTILEIHLFNNK
jgi:hypothetical protein